MADPTRPRSSSCRYSPCWASPGRRGGHDWRLIPVVPALFAFAWGASNSPPEEAAALVLVSLSCALATIVVAAVPGAVAKAGIVAWAATDLALAVANHLEQASRAITNAAPAVGPLAFFLVTNVLPATVPAAVALGLEELRSHGRIGQMSPLRLHGRPLGG